MMRDQVIKDGQSTKAALDSISVDGSSLLVMAAQDRIVGSFVDVSADERSNPIDPMTGKPIFKRTYNNALLSMLTKANRPDQFGARQKREAEDVKLEIAGDLDPPQVMRGRSE